MATGVLLVSRREIYEKNLNSDIRSVQGLGKLLLRGLDLGFVFFIYVECTNNTPSIEPDKGSQKHDTFSHEPVTVWLTALWKAIQPQLVKARIQAPILLPTSLRRTKDV